MSDPRYVILSPHVDDEMIGCYPLLDARQVDYVVYFYDVDIEREREAVAAGLRYGFEVVFGEEWEDFKSNHLSDDHVIAAPNIADEHPDHKAVNRLAKQLSNEKIYYSIDMNVKKEVLSPEMQYAKRQALYKLYPSQAKLFDRDDKYHLFSSLVHDDSNKMIWVKFQKEGIHCYPRALEDESLADVSFLGHPHRHMFHFRVWIEVFHDDRDLEFIQFKRWLESLYEGTLELNYKSCEMLADELAVKILSKYPDRRLKIEVSEDDENGAEVTYG